MLGEFSVCQAIHAEGVSEARAAGQGEALGRTVRKLGGRQFRPAPGHGIHFRGLGRGRARASYLLFPLRFSDRLPAVESWDELLAG